VPNTNLFKFINLVFSGEEKLSQTTQAPQIGHFQILDEIKQDPFSITYKAIALGGKDLKLIQVLNDEVVSGQNFIVRYELLRGLLPTISHPNLIKIEELTTEENLYYLVKEFPSDDGQNLAATMDQFNPNDSPHRLRSLEAIFEGIANGLLGLKKISNSFYKNGIVHDLLNPTQIYLTVEKSIVGGSPKPKPKIDGFIDSFLFFGDELSSNMLHRLNHSSADPFALEWMIPPNLRTITPSTHSDPLFQFGSLIYRTITGKIPKGTFSPLREIDLSLDPLWDEIINLSLGALHEKNLTSAAIDQVVHLFKEMSQKRNALGVKERKIRNTKVPAGMALVAFDEKIELGTDLGAPEEGPPFRAKLKPFFIDLAPVSVAQFTKFMSSYKPSTYSVSPSHPATLVTWHMAKAYCNWRADQEGLPLDTYRLPTEYEWEAAARGGMSSLYPWGEQMDPRRACCNREREDGALPIGSFPPGRFGLLDMLGNVWEWTESTFKAHPFSSHLDKRYNALYRTVKGGCWFTSSKQLRSTLREAYKPHQALGHVGFRCVRPVELDDSSPEAQQS
jgi:formylglycine-generating enzyme required for sulfatase activity